MNSVKYEMSKTYQYRKVMKPMLERKRRARINRCLDELKDLIVEYMKQKNGDTHLKMEKADILELTVQHLRNIKSIKSTASSNTKESFRTGYIQAANEVSRCLAYLPNVDIALGTKVMTHLGFRLNELASGIEVNWGSSIELNAPLKVYCEAENVYTQQLPTMSSPVSSGYGSDSECSTSSLLSHSSPQLLLKVALDSETKNRVENATVWRPW